MSITDPTGITGLRLWVSAEAIAGSPSDGSQISQWDDLSGNANHLTGVAGSGGAKPLYRTTAGGAGGPAVEFQSGSADAVGGYFTIPSGAVSGLTAATAWAIVKSAQGRTTLWKLGDSGNSHYPFDNIIYENSFNNAGAGTLTGAFSTLDDWHRYSVTASATQMTGYLDGTQIDSPFSRTFAVPTSPKLGGGPAYNFAGHVTAFCIFDHDLTSGERSDLETWGAANPSGGTAGAGPTTINGGFASEADSALTGSITRGVLLSGGLATEADSALAGSITAHTLISGGIATETDTALSGSLITGFAINGGIAVETDSALAGSIVVGTVISGGIATETDTALAGTMEAPTVIAGGIATEADTALPGTVTLGYSTTDTTNRVGGRVRSGYGVATWEPPVEDPADSFIGPAVHDFDKAHAFVAPTVTNGRVIPHTPTYGVAARHRDRIIVGGKDITFFRGVPTPTPSFRLIEPLLYGAASLVLPQVNLLFEQRGVGDLSWLDLEKTVRVQRVDTATNEVVGEDYVGFIQAIHISGDSVTCDVAGMVSGQAALMDRQPVLFRQTKDVGNWVYSAVTQASRAQFTPRLGPVTGIRLASRGGSSMLDYISELLALSAHQSGAQWTVGRRDNGTWGMWVKDRTTIDATLYFDDARIVADIDNDISENPNRIFVTGVTPEGRRVKFGAYPGLKQGPAPEYPMDDNSSFGVGTTNGDTDTGDGITVMLAHLVTMGYLTPANNDGAYDTQVERALKELQAEAGLTRTGIVNVATWRALFDLSATGYSLANSRILPAAQDPAVRRYNLTSTGAIAEVNPLWNPHKKIVDHSINVGSGFTVQQMRVWARDLLREGNTPNWVGTATCHFALVRGEHTPGTTIPTADVMSARELRPGMNVWEPNFDGGTLFHVSGVEVPAGGRSPVITIDTRFRDTIAAWECITRNRESRNNTGRTWLSTSYRGSSMNKDHFIEFDEVGGIIDESVALTAGWNHFPVLAGQAGTVEKIRIETYPPTEFVVSVSAREISDNRMTHLVPNPLTEAGSERWETPWVRNQLEDRVWLESWGGYHQPCGYGSRRKYNDNDELTGAPLTGVFEDAAGIGYHTFAEPVLYVAIWAESACRVRAGRIMWPQLEAGS